MDARVGGSGALAGFQGRARDLPSSGTCNPKPESACVTGCRSERQGPRGDMGELACKLACLTPRDAIGRHLEMSERVRPLRVAIVTGVLAAISVYAVFLIRAVPDRVVSLLGGPSGGVDRIGGLRVHYRPPAGMD